MGIFEIIIACLVCFFVSGISVSIGGTSLITVPMLIWLGMASKNAVATNMFALIFLSASGAIGFKKKLKPAHYKMIFILSVLTVLGSLVGANLVVIINKDVLQKIIAVIICIIAGSFLVKKDLGVKDKKKAISKITFSVGMISVFILGIYGGFFSGGYVTLLSYVLILVFGLDFLQTAFITKIFNIFSSLVACALFYVHGLIDFSIGIPLALSMSLGAFWGAKLAISKGNLWIRNLFIIVVILLAVKLLIF